MKNNFSVKDYIFFAILLIGLALMVSQKIMPKEEGELDKKAEKAKIEVGGVLLEVFIADTEEKRYLGLSEIEQMAFNQGALFIHEVPGIHSYSMRGMRFDLDFIFILEDKIVDIAKNVAREYEGEIKGAAEYDKVLEVSAEWARRNNVKIGDHVKIE